MCEVFARLEEINGRQILAELFNGDEGPCVRFRRDDGISAEIKLGPFSDDERGWDAANDMLLTADLADWAGKLDQTLKMMSPE